jgi:hypothetical protein
MSDEKERDEGAAVSDTVRDARRAGNRLRSDVRRAPRRMPMNCYKCGRFIGPDGNPDVCEVDCGVYEVGYPTCGRCLKRELARCEICKTDCGTMAGLIVHVRRFHPASTAT